MGILSTSLEVVKGLICITIRPALHSWFWSTFACPLPTRPPQMYTMGVRFSCLFALRHLLSLLYLQTLFVCRLLLLPFLAFVCDSNKIFNREWQQQQLCKGEKNAISLTHLEENVNREFFQRSLSVTICFRFIGFFIFRVGLITDSVIEINDVRDNVV